MRIGVTGTTGYIGSKLVTYLIEREYEVVCFKRPEIDILTSPLNFSKLDHIVHLSALTSVVDSWRCPDQYITTNVSGTTRVLEAAKTYSVPVTYLSSYVYGHPLYQPVDENHPLQAYNPYALSKQMAESICGFYRSVNGLNINIIRPFNIYGPGQSEDFVIAAIVKKIFNKEPSIVMRDLVPQRDYLHIDDLLDLILKSIGQPSNATVNACSGSSYTVKELVDFCQELAGVSKPVLSSLENRKNEVNEIVGSNVKAFEVFKWSPKIDIQTGLRQTIAHYKSIHLPNTTI